MSATNRKTEKRNITSLPSANFLMVNWPPQVKGLPYSSRLARPELGGQFHSARLVADEQELVCRTLGGFQQFAHAPHVVDPRSHRGRHAKRLVDAAEIVEREPARDSGPQWFSPLFAEAVRQPGKSAQAHARAQNCSARQSKCRCVRDRVTARGLPARARK